MRPVIHIYMCVCIYIYIYIYINHVFQAVYLNHVFQLCECVFVSVCVSVCVCQDMTTRGIEPVLESCPGFHYRYADVPVDDRGICTIRNN